MRKEGIGNNRVERLKDKFQKFSMRCFLDLGQSIRSSTFVFNVFEANVYSYFIKYNIKIEFPNRFRAMLRNFLKLKAYL